MTRRRWRVAAGAGAVLLAVLTGCAQDSTSNRGAAPAPDAGQLTATPGVVRAGICLPSGTQVPLPQDRVERFQVELLRRLGFKLALRMQVSKDLRSCQRPAVELGGQRVDLVASAPGQETGGQPGTLATEPYLVVQYALVVGGSRADRQGLAALTAGSRVGVIAGSQGAAWARARLGRRGVRVVPFTSQQAAVAALVRGACNALVLPRAGAVRATGTVTGLRVNRLLDTGERATFLVAAANPAFRSRIDRMLEEIVFDGSYAAIFSRHLAPTPVPVDFLPPD